MSIFDFAPIERSKNHFTHFTANETERISRRNEITNKSASSSAARHSVCASEKTLWTERNHNHTHAKVEKQADDDEGKW